MGFGISDLRGAFEGDRVWIVGNGPSAENWQMEEMRDLGGYVFGTNRCWMASPRTGARFVDTDFHTFVSGQHFDDLISGRVSTGTAFIPSRFARLLIPSPAMGVHFITVSLFDERWNAAADGRPFGYDFDGEVVSTFAGHLALALAVYMGFAQILLVGFDANDCEGHFFDKGPPLLPAGFKRDSMVLWFDAVRDWLVSPDGGPKPRILNTNPDSAIRVFPFVTKEAITHGALEDGVFA